MFEDCPHCGASPDERGRHAHQGYCEVCNGEPGHLEHIARLKQALEDIGIAIIKNPASCPVDEATLAWIKHEAAEAIR